MYSIRHLVQADGSKVTSYYMSYIFINSLGISELLARILAAAGSLDYLLFSCLAYFVIERYGRRKVRDRYHIDELCLPITGHDVLCCRLLDMLDCHCSCSRSDRGWRQLLQAGHYCRLILLRLLCQLRDGCSGCAVVVSNRVS